MHGINTKKTIIVCCVLFVAAMIKFDVTEHIKNGDH
jgi:hypothetical protein